jgi:hypothetical protein
MLYTMCYNQVVLSSSIMSLVVEVMLLIVYNNQILRDDIYCISFSDN